MTADCPVVEDDPDRRSAEEEVEKEAESLTGLQVGGISALALINRGFDVYIDRAATELSHILVSAGCRGINLKLRVEDLIRITKARVVEATAEVDE